MPPGGTWRAQPTKFSDLNTAARIKRIVEKIADKRIDRKYPRPRYATVNTVITSTRRAIVEYPDEPGQTFTLRYGGVVPSVGSLVRVTGPAGGRYIDDVLTLIAGGGSASLPIGGSTDQVLAKASAADGDVYWKDDATGGGGGGPSQLDPFYADYVTDTDTSAQLPITGTHDVATWYITMVDTAALVLDVLVNGVAEQRLNLTATSSQTIASTIPQLVDGDEVQIEVIDAAGGGASGLVIIGKLS